MKKKLRLPSISPNLIRYIKKIIKYKKNLGRKFVLNLANRYLLPQISVINSKESEELY